MHIHGNVQSATIAMLGDVAIENAVQESRPCVLHCRTTCYRGRRRFWLLDGEERTQRFFKCFIPHSLALLWTLFLLECRFAERKAGGSYSFEFGARCHFRSQNTDIVFQYDSMQWRFNRANRAASHLPCLKVQNHHTHQPACMLVSKW